ncbi:hypothetical protein B0A52_00282 [Exophiala mesophila]|uniref:UDENN domain-containing protein n=1 Tax=Exophiala mesophila TaxID=212818 RepID=A0A438NJN0_EXOME|nr:hypothetical protein B0A52_00282 [Exophiala mesophila]
MASTEIPQPLADYFWIAGLDGQQLSDAYSQQRWSYEPHDISNGVDTSIQEETTPDNDSSSVIKSSPGTSKHSRHDSYQRLSQLSDEARFSIQSLDELTRPQSSRSSITIRPTKESNLPRSSSVFTELDFDNAIQKFTNDRDAFFLDLTFAAPSEPQKPQKHAPSKSRPQTQIIVASDEPGLSPNRNFGSIRRHLSFKDMASTKRQPSVARHLSVRTSRRMSSYNSVIPDPSPFKASPDKHPLARKFEPVLLERYPRSTTVDRFSSRVPFPDYVPMFAFPGDIKIQSSDTRPRTTWHQFSMTASDNSRLFGIQVTVWIPLSPEIALNIERKCQEWQKDHMSDAEREMAASLAERLAHESAKLSRLLVQLPQLPDGSHAREELEEEISAVEEKIGVMSEMLRPLRHGSNQAIPGLTTGDTKFWIPRAYGIIGRDGAMPNFWRQWLRAVVVPMMDGSVLRIPPSSPKTGMWQPLERYVATLCLEAPAPISSKTQVQVSIRELHMFAKKEAINELPGSRTTDLYPLFRTLTIPNIVLLFEYVLAESRIVLLSSHTSMLQMVSRAILDLIWPLEWTGVYIPVLPARLVGALDAPCPYICGIDRKYDKHDLPDDDYVLVDLDKNELLSFAAPPLLPKQQRRKLMSLLHQAAPLHHSFGVAPGPPAYAVETFPFDAFAAENESVFTAITKSTNLSKLASLSSTAFGPQASADTIRRAPMFNVFLSGAVTRGKSIDGRPQTSSTIRQSSQTGSDGQSPIMGSFALQSSSAMSRNDSGYALQTSLREKRSGHFDSLSKRSFSGPQTMMRKASIPFIKHNATPSNASLSDMRNGSTYAGSVYAQSTLAASTIMPGMAVHPATASPGSHWVEGHCLEWKVGQGPSTCVLCDEKAQDDYYRCGGCGFVVHDRCAAQITIVCSAAFFPDQIRAAFVRCLASLFYTYRRFMQPTMQTSSSTPRGKKSAASAAAANKSLYRFDRDGFIKSLPADHAEYMDMLHQTQAWNEFIMDREENPPTTPSIALFDAIINAKRGRAGLLRSSLPGIGLGRKSFASRSVSAAGLGGGRPDILSDTSTHQWRIINIPGSAERLDLGAAAKGRDYRDIVTRTPAKLEEGFFKQEEKVPEIPTFNNNTQRKPRLGSLNARLNGLGMNAP